MAAYSLVVAETENTLAWQIGVFAASVNTRTAMRRKEDAQTNGNKQTLANFSRLSAIVLTELTNLCHRTRATHSLVTEYTAECDCILINLPNGRLPTQSDQCVQRCVCVYYHGAHKT